MKLTSNLTNYMASNQMLDTILSKLCHGFIILDDFISGLGHRTRVVYTDLKKDLMYILHH